MKGRPAQALELESAFATTTAPRGDFVQLDGEAHYRIAAYDRMPAFLTNVASATDLWMFLTSSGGLTAGRVDAEGSLFPYRTVDELHEAHHHTGPMTRVRIESPEGSAIHWTPFESHDAPDNRCERNLYKSVTGNRVVFEEIRPDLGLVFRYAWSGCDRFGWVRTATLENRGADTISVSILDGLRNVLPFGAPLGLYQTAGNLVDAYKKSELDPETGLGIFSLTAGITDRAEALEVLRANTVWCCGLDDFKVHLSEDVIGAFAAGRLTSERSVLNGTRGNYLISARIDLEPNEFQRWHLACDVGRSQRQIVDLRQRIGADPELETFLEQRLLQARETLRRAVAAADGLQLTGRPASWSHHFSNVLYNNMRGGVFADGYRLPSNDLIDFIETHNRVVARRHSQHLNTLPPRLTIQELYVLADASGDCDLQRLCYEYLPLHFGRRHGDPSRPWNQFSIRIRNADGDPLLNYEGNWRDIFQNWEALNASYPDFLPGTVAKFLNASTVDGFNPYRINREGIDWEVEEPENPWSNIGYWGDHQIIYLLKLLEAWHDHDSGGFDALLDREIFSYADVPYRIKPYAELLDDPNRTIVFDRAAAARSAARVQEIGSDGRLLTDADGKVHHANLFEKLLVPALSKLSNMIPDAGIWMNTQRPEWNDANNALAGGGVSVVTLCYLRRYLAFLADRFEDSGDLQLPIAEEIADWFDGIAAALAEGRNALTGGAMQPAARRRLLDRLGMAFSTYREQVYDHGFGGRRMLSTHRVAEFCRAALEHVDWGIRANRRPDGLYHAYNLLEVEGSKLQVERLQEMLEGQVAVLSSGLLDAEESRDILDRLFASALYVPEQRSFLLYPECLLPGFLSKNTVSAARVEQIPLLVELARQRRTTIIERDADGTYRFQADLSNAALLDEELDRMAGDPALADRVQHDRAAIGELFEDTFDHSSYTGRSGTMYGYEGLGCIYWHMVAKLLLAVQETTQRARENEQPSIAADLQRMYYRIRSGIGYEKTPSEFGAFPTDPYSHTPSSGGAKQPGMTGQVKEEILTRRGELGLRVENGCACFEPKGLRPEEFVTEMMNFEYYNTDGQARILSLTRGSLAFTWCQVPVIYELNGNSTWIQIEFEDGAVTEVAGTRMDTRISREIMGRTGRVRSVRIGIPADSISG